MSAGVSAVPGYIRGRRRRSGAGRVTVTSLAIAACPPEAAGGARSRRHRRGAKPGTRVATRGALERRCAAWAAIDGGCALARPTAPEARRE
ncbi:unnamed protein product [Arctia plantaginis]|uniref:Uncharacterized protein n=1 Tax=Arctia plantaginis TaxID=874455 RepID=A0A8S0ZNW2_ARCPL|nr:unnamed protein product [Arctia plantaginis]CAB3252075.1 unnamed protein product [Arctia plantaginis]